MPIERQRMTAMKVERERMTVVPQPGALVQLASRLKAPVSPGRSSRAAKAPLVRNGILSNA
jgi:hypothetical protein